MPGMVEEDMPGSLPSRLYNLDQDRFEQKAEDAGAQADKQHNGPESACFGLFRKVPDDKCHERDQTAYEHGERDRFESRNTHRVNTHSSPLESSGL